MPRCSQRVVPLTGDPTGIPTNTPDHFPAQAEGLGGPCGTRGTPSLYRAMWASNLAADHLKSSVKMRLLPDLTHTRSPAPFQTSADTLNMRT